MTASTDLQPRPISSPGALADPAPLDGDPGRPPAGRRPLLRLIFRFAALAAAIGLVLFLLLRDGDGHRYELLFQNAGQLVPDNQVLIGGHPVGSVEEIELTEDNLARVEISIEQELHDGTTADIRVTSISGLANRYISISPGPGDAAPLPREGSLGVGETTTPVEIDELFNTFTPRMRQGFGEFIQGNAALYAGVAPQANRTYKYFAPALGNTRRFFRELNADQGLLRRFVQSSSRLATAVAARGEELSTSIGRANTTFGAIASRNEELSSTLAQLPPTMRRSNTTFVNLRAALDDLDPLVETAKPATRELGPFMRELRPVVSRGVPVTRDLRLTMRREGRANDLGELVGSLPRVHPRAARAFRRAIGAIEDFQPTLDFAVPYSPDLFGALAKLGQITGYYDGNGHYARAGTAMNLFGYDAATRLLEPIPPEEQFAALDPAGPHTPCPGGAARPAADGSNPFVNPPWPASTLGPDDCDPSDTPGP